MKSHQYIINALVKIRGLTEFQCVSIYTSAAKDEKCEDGTARINQSTTCKWISELFCYLSIDNIFITNIDICHKHLQDHKIGVKW